MSEGTLTIAIPIYNDGKYLRDTLESCLHQAPAIKLYDNCSTDDCESICREYERKHDHITYIRHAENLGAWENFKRCLFECKTEYFMWLGAHDKLGETYTEPLLNALKLHQNAALAVGKIYHMDEEGKLKDKVTDLGQWSKKLAKEEDALTRMAAFIQDHFGSKKHDSFLLHGVFRTDLLRKAWIDAPCVAFDDALLTRVAAFGNIVHDNQATFYARWFTKTRKKEDEHGRIFKGNQAPKVDKANERQTLVVTVLETALQISRETGNLKGLFPIYKLVEECVVKPSRARKKRLWKKIILALSLLGTLAIIAVIYMYFM